MSTHALQAPPTEGPAVRQRGTCTVKGNFCSKTQQLTKAMDSPSASARAVRPERCTYTSTDAGSW